jgi:hypothetical protein
MHLNLARPSHGVNSCGCCLRNCPVLAQVANATADPVSAERCLSTTSDCCTTVSGLSHSPPGLGGECETPWEDRESLVDKRRSTGPGPVVTFTVQASWFSTHGPYAAEARKVTCPWKERPFVQHSLKTAGGLARSGPHCKVRWAATLCTLGRAVKRADRRNPGAEVCCKTLRSGGKLAKSRPENPTGRTRVTYPTRIGEEMSGDSPQLFLRRS